MITIANDARIFIFTGSTDMRKGFHGLISLVQKFSEDPVDAWSSFGEWLLSTLEDE